MNVAILGGGISGLTAAYLLSRRLPHLSITVLESSLSHWGGWIESTRHVVDNGHGAVVFEKGPRTIRPRGLAGAMTLSLVDQLNLTSSLIRVPTHHPSAQNRYIYYPDRLVRVPTSIGVGALSTLLFDPLCRPLPSAFVQDWRTPAPASRSQQEWLHGDESVESFITRRFGHHVNDTLVSAILRGIYAADPSELSVRSTLPFLWNAERHAASVLKSMLLPWKNVPKHKREQVEKDRAEELLNGRQDVNDMSVWSLQGGMESLVHALTRHLATMPNVQLLSGQHVDRIELRDETYHVHTSTTCRPFTHLLSCLPPHTLASLFPQDATLNQLLRFNTCASVAVVNLSFSPPFQLPSHLGGFGYLIPKSIPHPHLSNPHGVLGMVFDSETIQGLDEGTGQHHVKVTVLIGGPYWKPQHNQITMSPQHVPSHDDLVHAALESLQRHVIGSVGNDINSSTVTLPQPPKHTHTPPTTSPHSNPGGGGGDAASTAFLTPSASQVSIQWNCIPTYAPGHESRLGSLHRHLKQQYHGRLSMVGNGFGGVGVNDCVRSSWEWVECMLNPPPPSSSATGLERWAERRTVVDDA